MDPMTMMAIASMVGAGTGVLNTMKKTPGQSMFAEPVKTGSKPMMSVGNPYQSPMATTGQDPYGQMQDYQQMYRPNRLSSVLGRYGGLG